MEDILIKTLPILYGKTSKGQSKVWISRILTNTTRHGIYEIEYGAEGGKLQLTRRVITTGKNIGKTNETTPLDQCTAELQKKWIDKQNKEGYWDPAAAPSTAPIPDAPAPAPAPAPFKRIAPMLAQTYTPEKPKKHDIIFPCYVQPKLDGLRCLMYISPATGNVIAQSRTGGIFQHMGHITTYLAPFLSTHPNIILDGELYCTEIPFENLAGLIKKKNIDTDDLTELAKIKYHIYDYIDRQNADITFDERNTQMHAFARALTPAPNSAPNSIPIVFVSTYVAATPTEFREKFANFIEAGYEGLMLRNARGIYKQNYRSADLQKYKEFQEDEFTVVDFKQGDGKDAGTVIWICETEPGRAFSVRPKGSVEYRRALFENAANYIGAKLTVIFQELSELGVPRFPVGKCIRENGI